MRVMNRVTKLGAIANAVGEQAGKLFHFADRVRHFRCNQIAKIAGEQMVGSISDGSS